MLSNREQRYNLAGSSFVHGQGVGAEVDMEVKPGGEMVEPDWSLIQACHRPQAIGHRPQFMQVSGQ